MAITAARKIPAALSRVHLPDLPPGLLRSITWDQGTEMARHRTITRSLGAPVYFCVLPLALAARRPARYTKGAPQVPRRSLRGQRELAQHRAIGRVYYGRLLRSQDQARPTHARPAARRGST